MPHSSGGGSHGGGGHGGHGGGHGGGGARSSSRPFTGAKRYVYYSGKKPHIIYADYDVTKDSTSFALLIMGAVMFFIFGFTMLIPAAVAFFPPVKKTMEYDTEIIIEDRAQIISESEEDALMEELEEFRNKTGITPAFFTVNNEDWEKEYKNLEKYSYDLYLDEFKDEKHWLIVYSEPEAPDADFNDWYWEGMQGDNTDSILSRKKTEIFNKSFQKNLLKRDKYTVAQALTESFDEFNKVVMERNKDDWKISLVFGIMSLITNGVAVVFIVFGVRSKKQKKTAFECTDEVIRQATCEYCGGIYIVGHHNNCPHCQAQIPYSYAIPQTQ